MWPEQVPVFRKEDMLISEVEYESDDGRKTTVGWLKELFLFEKIDEEWIHRVEFVLAEYSIDHDIDFKKLNAKAIKLYKVKHD